jgi:LAS superfamily LD-carboxypeptidase LdcB
MQETTHKKSKRTLSLPETAARKKQPSNEPTMPISQLAMIETIANKLDVEDASECLIQLARVFREQSALCLQQAERLDRMAADQEEDGPQVLPMSRESLLMQLQRKSVLALVDKSADIMIQSQQMLDGIENRLVPFEQKQK